MKKLILLLALAMVITITIFAQAPQAFKYQAIARDASGNILADQAIGIKINILLGNQDGPVLFSETHQVQTNSFGLINIDIGKGEVRAGNFSTINWGGNSHYVQVEMDPAGGTDYEVMGIAELLSVPYALYADKAGTGGNRSGEWTNNGTNVFVDETAFPGASVGIGVTNPNAKIEVAMQYGFNSIFKRVNNTPTANSLFLLRRARGLLGEESPIVNGDYIGQIGFEGRNSDGGYNRAAVLAVKTDGTSGAGIPGYMEFRTRNVSGTMNINMIIDSDGKVGIGITNPHQSAILEVNAPTKGFLPPRMTTAGRDAIISPADGLVIFNTSTNCLNFFAAGYWVETIGVANASTVTNPTTGETWMDRNLGASQVATSSTDAAAYGDLYQWGRLMDGHERRISDTTSTLSSTDEPGHGNYILVTNDPKDWRSPQNNNLWQGVITINNPCPNGFRLPTDEELDAERQSWATNDAAGAYGSPLKLTVGGYRYHTDGSLNSVGSYGYYWSSILSSGTHARSLSFGSCSATMVGHYRAYGFSVRCIKD